jgi:hypothetical protein
MKQLHLLFLLLVSVCFGDESAPIQILGIGNSFTVNAQRFLPQIIASDAEVEADVAGAIIGGCPLDKHVNLAKSHEADPETGKNYRYNVNGEYVPEKVSLKHILQDRDWDYITIQQVSTKSYKIETYYPYAKELIDYIHRYAPQAEIVMHETWSHSVYSHRATEWGLDPREMYAQLHAAYGQVAAENGLRVIPVGTAFEHARASDDWHYEPTTIDIEALRYPEDKDNLPDESRSMNITFRWRQDKEGNWFVGNDGFHAGPNGEYLGGLTWYAFFFGKDPRTLDYKPDQLTEAQAISLREIAHETITADSATVAPAP